MGNESNAHRAHCWAYRSDVAEQRYGWCSPEHCLAMMAPEATCMLWDGHRGPHRWTPDSRIGIRFTGAPAGVDVAASYEVADG